MKFKTHSSREISFILFSLWWKAPQTAKVSDVLFEDFCIYPYKRTSLNCYLLASISAFKCAKFSARQFQRVALTLPPGFLIASHGFALRCGFSERFQRVWLIPSRIGEWSWRKGKKKLCRGEEELLLLRSACGEIWNWNKLLLRLSSKVGELDLPGRRRSFEQFCLCFGSDSSPCRCLRCGYATGGIDLQKLDDEVILGCINDSWWRISLFTCRIKMKNKRIITWALLWSFWGYQSCSLSAEICQNKRRKKTFSLVEHAGVIRQ